MIKYITKRNGDKEPFSPDKLNRWAEWACEGGAASWAAIAGLALPSLKDGCTSLDLQNSLIDAAEGLIPTDYSYDVPAKNLYLANIRKEVFGQFEPLNLLAYIKLMEQKGKWSNFSSKYTLDELCALAAAIDHTRDLLFTYGGLKQCADKYLLKDYGKLIETPQFMYMGMCLATGLDAKGIRNDWTINQLIDLYHEFSLQRVNVPTPPLVGLRTHSRGFASCCLISAGDSIESLDAANSAIFRMTAARAGIGYIAQTRSLGDTVRNGSFKHTGKLPFYRTVDRLTKALTQESRGGSCTVFYPFFDPEIIDLLNLKSQRVSEDKRIEFLDYALQDNSLLSELYAADGKVKLISIAKHPEVYEAFYGKDLSLFKELYNGVTGVETIPARDLVHTFLTRRLETGRMYWMDVHNTNDGSVFKDSVSQSNLCVAPDTLILTDKGEYPIIDLVGKDVNVWNGGEFSPVVPQQTGSDQKMVKVSFNDGTTINCTPYHRFFVVTNYSGGTKEVRAGELRSGDKLVKVTYPIIEGSKTLEHPYTNGFFTGDATQFIKVDTVEEASNSDTYCFTETKRGMGVFNGVLAGNCMEIVQPTTPFKSQLHMQHPNPSPEDGEISLCNLGGAVWGRITDWDKSMYLLVKFIDTIIDLQDIPCPAVEVMSKRRRNIAVGVINLAGFLAENGLSYEGEAARDLVNETGEQMLYSIIKASVTLAKERGRCELFHRTTMADGILPVDLINKNSSKLVSGKPKLDWDILREDVKTYGTRNSTFTACMPGESSSVLLGATNGVEPIRSIVTTKRSGKGVLVTVAPKATEYTALASYQLAYDIDQDEYIKMMAVVQRWMTQAISTNQYYRYSDYPEERVPMSLLLRHWSMARYYGLKTLYYCNTDTGSVSSSMESCSSGGCTL